MRMFHLGGNAFDAAAAAGFALALRKPCGYFVTDEKVMPIVMRNPTWMAWTVQG